MRQMHPNRSSGGVHVFGAMASLIPLGIGVSVLVFLWAAPFDAWDSPPLFFRVFGSFIALAFVMVGGRLLFGALQGSGPTDTDIRDIGDSAISRQSVSRTGSPPTSETAFECPNCGAPLAGEADVSPHGDVKCGHCGCWFNIHGRGG